MNQRTQRSISIRKQILGKLKLSQIEGNPICPVNKVYRLKQTNTSKRIPTIEEQIFSTQSTKLIKPYNTEKLINLQSSDYQICSVLRSSSYQKLQTKLTQMMTSFSKQKKQLSKDIRKIDSLIQQQTEKTADLCKRLKKLDDSYDRLENEYYERKRQNYELRVELDQRMQGLGIWRVDLSRMQPFAGQQTIDLDQMSYQQILQMEERLGKHNVGMGKDKINQLKVQQLKDLAKERENESKACGKEGGLNCCICCDGIQEEESVIKLDCEHIHHASCIKQWLKIKRFCPLCKGQVVIH